jgi:hypothetical protein
MRLNRGGGATYDQAAVEGPKAQYTSSLRTPAEAETQAAPEQLWKAGLL